MFEGSEAAAKYIDTIIDAKLNGAALEPEVRATLHHDLLKSLETHVTRDLIAQLNAEQQENLERLIDNNQTDKIEQYLRESGIDLNRVLAGAMTDFQAAYLGA